MIPLSFSAWNLTASANSLAADVEVCASVAKIESISSLKFKTCN